MGDLPKSMCLPRKARPLTRETKDTWFYVQPRCIEIMTQNISGGITGAKLTRKQLERALEIMDDYLY